MTKAVEQELRKVAVFSPTDRAELAVGTLASFDFPGCEEIDAAWGREAEDRIDAFNRGEIAAIPAVRVLEKIETM